MTCGKCGSNYILEERQYDYATRSAVYTPYCGKCGQRGRYGFVVEGKTIYPGLWADQTKEETVSSLKCIEANCDKQAQKFGLCRRHFKEQHGMTLDTYNAKKVKEMAAQKAEVDYILEERQKEMAAQEAEADYILEERQKEMAAQEAEADPPYPFANPETGKPMGRCKRVQEVYQYELDALSATVTISDGKLAGIKVRWENGEEWSIKDTDMPFLSGLVKEVEGLCRI